MSISFPLTSNGTTYRARRAVIERSHFGLSAHGGVMTIELSLSYVDGGSGMSVFGGYALDAPCAGGGSRRATAYGMDFAMKVLDAAGVTSWEDVRGNVCLALFAAADPQGNEDDFWGTHPVGIAALEGNHVLIGEDHAALWAESLLPVPELGEELTAGEQITTLQGGSILSFTALNGTARIAVNTGKGWSVTGAGKNPMDDFALWLLAKDVVYRGTASPSARGNALKYDQLEDLAKGTSVLLGRDNFPGVGLRNRDGSWSVTGMRTLLSTEELWDLFSPLFALPSDSVNDEGGAR